MNVLADFGLSIYQNRDLIVGSSGWSQAGGEFVNNSGNLDINGDFTLSGAGTTFTAPSGTMSIAGNVSKTGGTFTHNNGTVVFDGTGGTMTWTFQNLYNVTR